MAAAAILDFRNLNFLEDQTASLCQILTKSLQSRPTYGDFLFFKVAAADNLDFRNLKFLTLGTVNSVIMTNLVEIAPTVDEICEFLYYAGLAWKCLFTPLLGFFETHFPQMMSLIVLSPKRTVLGLNHVIWAIKREYCWYDSEFGREMH